MAVEVVAAAGMLGTGGGRERGREGGRTGGREDDDDGHDW